MIIDTIVLWGGIIYGFILVTGTFVRTRLTELLRIDSVLIPRPSEKTRIMNLIAGLAFIGYNTYTLLK